MHYDREEGKEAEKDKEVVEKEEVEKSVEKEQAHKDTGRVAGDS